MALDGFESQPVSEELIDQATHVFAMTVSHLQSLVSLFPEHEDKFYLASASLEMPVAERAVEMHIDENNLFRQS